MTMQTPTKDREPPPARANGAPSETMPTAALPLDLATLSDEAVTALAVEVPRELERRRARVLESLTEQARALGMPVTRLAAWVRAQTAVEPSGPDALDGRTIVVPKYRDPATGATWSGRGEAPPWVEFGPETLPPSKPGGKVRRVPLKKFWISEQGKK